MPTARFEPAIPVATGIHKKEVNGENTTSDTIFSIKSKVNEERTYSDLPINDNVLWRTRYKIELYKPYDQLDIVEVVKTGILRWLGRVFRIQELDPCRKLAVLRPEGTRRLGEPQLKWLEPDEEDLKKMGVWNWRRK